jgi:hypothetical protein
VKPFFVAILSPDQLERPAEGERVQFYLCTGCMPFEDTRIDRKTYVICLVMILNVLILGLFLEYFKNWLKIRR